MMFIIQLKSSITANYLTNLRIGFVREKFNVDMSVNYTNFETGTYFRLKCSAAALLSDVVYKFNCLRGANCSYIGISTRYLTIIVHQHPHFTPTKTHIAEHLKVIAKQIRPTLFKSATQNRRPKSMKLYKSRKSIPNSTNNCMPLILCFC